MMTTLLPESKICAPPDSGMMRAMGLLRSSRQSEVPADLTMACAIVHRAAVDSAATTGLAPSASVAVSVPSLRGDGGSTARGWVDDSEVPPTLVASVNELPICPQYHRP
jgi:hypothetical protein